MTPRVAQLEAVEEIVSLNADDLQVEELERRLELALLAPLEADEPAEESDCGLRNCSCYCPELTRCKRNC